MSSVAHALHLSGLDEPERGQAAKMTDNQWNDAFRAGGYAETMANRLIRRFKESIQEGLALPKTPGGAGQ
jgi:hypothetical protein